MSNEINYTYDHAGTRTVKSHGPMEAVYVNGAPQGINYHDEENYTVYVSPYMTVTADRYTKHYFSNSQRIASKLGTGEFDNVYGVNNFHLTAGQKDYAERMVQIEESRQEYMKQNGIPPGVPTQKGQNIEPEITGAALPNKPLGNYDVPDGWPTPPHFNEKGDVPGPPLQWEEPEDISNPSAGYGYQTDNEEENDIFFFHTDHLGSTAYMTNKNGETCQFISYMPYGEAIIDEHNTDYENPFKFTGMELDPTTGLYDHGARQRDPIHLNWLNPDPLCEKNVAFSPYSYCVGNPVKFIDPNGCDGVITIKDNQITISANVYIYGEGADKNVLNQMQKDVNERWGGSFSATSAKGTIFNVSVNINISLYHGKEKNTPFIIIEKFNPFNRDNFIEISDNDNRSYVLGGDEGKWRSCGRMGMSLAQDDPAPHETGHLLGLRDRYKDIKGKSVSNIGWENNIMGNSRTGKVEQRNIDGILNDAMNEYNNWIQDPQNIGKEFIYEINTNTMDN